MPPTPSGTKKILEHSFNALLSAEDYALLSQLAELERTNMSVIIRQSIRWRHAFAISHAPTCSNGHLCLMPQMHPKPSPPPQGEPA